MSIPDEIVIAAVSRERLPALLTAVHRFGVGHLTRVLDPKRTPVAGQLTRAGVSMPIGFALEPDAVAVMIAAPARARRVEDLLRTHGAGQTWLAARAASRSPLPGSLLSAIPAEDHAGGVSELTD